MMRGHVTCLSVVPMGDVSIVIMIRAVILALEIGTMDHLGRFVG
jgi:hypothetical protein